MTTTGYTTVDAAVQLSYATSDVAWTGLLGVTTDTNVAGAFVTGADGTQSELLIATFNAATFSIPADARIDGIEVQYRCAADGGSSPNVYNNSQAYLVVGGRPTGLDRWQNDPISTTEETFTLGDGADTWGVPLTPSAINDGGFGVALRFLRSDGGDRGMFVYWVKINIHYTEGAGRNTPPAAESLSLIPMDANGDVSTWRVAFPGMGTPSAILTHFVNFARPQFETNDTSGLRDGWETVHGMSDGTETFGALNEMDDGVAISKTAVTRGEGDYVATRMLADLTVSGFGDGYVEFTGYGPHSPVLVHVVAFFADDAHMFEARGLDGSATEALTVAAGFEPDLLVQISMLEEPDDGSAHNQYAGMSTGYALNDGAGGFDQVCATQAVKVSQDNVTLADTEAWRAVFTDRFHYNRDVGNSGDPAGDQVYYVTADSPTATGYTLTGRGDNGTSDDGLVVLALRFNSASLDIGTFDMPTATGAGSIGSASFTPDLMLALATLGTGTGVQLDTAEGESAAHLIASHRGVVSHGWASENAVATLNTSTYWAEGLILRDGSQAIIEQGSAEIADGGLSVDMTTADATARKGVYLALGPTSSGTTISRTTAVSGQSSVTATATVTRSRGAAVAGASTVTVSATRTIARSAAISAQSTVTATASTGLDRTTTISAASSVNAQATVTRKRAASVAGQASVTATAGRTVRRSIAITATSQVTASTTGSVARSALIEASSGVSAVARLTKARAASVTATSAVQAVAGRKLVRTVQIDAGGALTAVSARTLRRQAEVAANSTVSVERSDVDPIAVARVTVIWDEPAATAVWRE